MRVAIIGAGSVGFALAEGFRRRGHSVVVGVRDPEDERHRHLEGRATAAHATDGADVVVLAVPASSLPELVPSLPLAPPTIVVDATNAVGGPVPGGAATVGALVRSLVRPEVPVVKAFNTIGAEHMTTGTVGGQPAFLPVAGDREAVSAIVTLARDLGFDAVAVDGDEGVALVEAHARLWIQLMRRGWGRDFGFTVAGEPVRDEVD